jgi:hypothetical protein
MKRIYLILIFIICTSWKNNENNFLTNVTVDYLSDIKKYILNFGEERLSRIVKDLNNDGLPDVLISGYYKGEWGNGGGTWTVYYQKPKNSFLIGEKNIFMHPKSAKCNIYKKEIITYNRLGCCEGIVSYFKILDFNINFEKSIKIKENIRIKLDSIFNTEIGFENFIVEKAIFKDSTKLVWE